MPCSSLTEKANRSQSNDRLIVVAKLNVDEDPGTATKYDILSIPTLLVFSGGQVVKKLVGAMAKKKLMDELAPWIG